MIHQWERDLIDFCSLDCERREYLQTWLNRRNISFSTIETDGKIHFFITPGGLQSYNNRYYIKLLIAHYDRVEGFPGANDNSAAVMQLLMFCEELNRGNKKHNVVVILSDGEEMSHAASYRDMGAYKLAEILKSKSMENCFPIILDMCGIGDSMVFCSSQGRISKGMQANFTPEFKTLKELIIKHSRGEEICQLEWYSDDIGFLAMGYPTVLISMIPWAERGFIHKKKMPPSWSTKHSPMDSVDQLQGQSFRIMGSFLRKLSDLLIF